MRYAALALTVVCCTLFLAVGREVDAASVFNLESRASKWCSQSTQCGQGTFCKQGKCAPKGAIGASCYKDNGCTSDLCFKHTGRCISTTYRPLTAPCTASTQCQSGYCGYSQCASKAKAGAYCYKDAGCLSSKCSANKCASGYASTTLVTNTKTSSTVTKTSPSSTSTTVLSSSTSSTSTGSSRIPASQVPAPPAPTYSVLPGGGFDSGNLGPFTASSSGVGSSLKATTINGNGVADGTIAVGGSTTLKYSAPASGRKRDTPVTIVNSAANAYQYRLNYHYLMYDFKVPPGVDGSDKNGTNHYYRCAFQAAVGAEKNVDRTTDIVFDIVQYTDMKNNPPPYWARGIRYFYSTVEKPPFELTFSCLSDRTSASYYLDNISLEEVKSPYNAADGGYLQNGGFENGYPPWGHFGGNNVGIEGLQGTSAITTTDVYQGTQAMKIEAKDGSTGSLMQIDIKVPYKAGDEAAASRLWFNMLSIGPSPTGTSSNVDGSAYDAATSYCELTMTRRTDHFGDRVVVNSVRQSAAALAANQNNEKGWQMLTVFSPTYLDTFQIDWYCSRGTIGTVAVDAAEVVYNVT